MVWCAGLFGGALNRIDAQEGKRASLFIPPPPSPTPHQRTHSHPINMTTTTYDSDPMRITKKFSGVGSIGKCVFHPRDPPNPEKAARAMREIEALEVRE